jgi:DNA-binding LacI/PurR family transcriptional regulator
MITIKHIARKLNLSVSTVGRALTDHPRISRETKDRVNSTARELGYIANAAARVMRSGSSHLIGLLVPDIRSAFYSTLAEVLSKTFKREGFHLTLSITNDDRDTEMEQARELLSARVAGIVVVPTAAPRRETLELLRMVPHVQVLRKVPGLGDWFGMDDERAILEATNHLFDLGHRRIGYVGDTIYSTGKARYQGFRKAHSDAGRKIEEALVELGPPDFRFGEDAVTRLMAKQPTALLTTSVLVTLGAAERLMALNIAVPDRLSVMGFGDGAWQKWWGPGLTTLQLPAEELATECGHWFMHRLKEKRPQSRDKPHLAISAIRRVLRGSAGPPAGQ